MLLLLLAGCRPQPVGEVAGLKLLVKQDGVYRVTRAVLQEAGLGVARWEQAGLRLTEAGAPVPYLLDGDSLLFYGRAPDSRYTAVRTYLLESGQPGTAMDEQAVPERTGNMLAGIERTHHLEANYEYISDALVDDRPPWFWQTIQMQGRVTISFSLPPVADGSGALELSIYGATHHPEANPDHSVRPVLNGEPLETITWDGQTIYQAELALPPGSLREGENSLVLENAPEDYLDIMRLDWVRIHYTAKPAAHGDRIAFQGTDGQVTLDGFSGRPFLFNVQNPTMPMLLTGWRYTDGVAHLGVHSTMEIVGAGPDGFLSPSGIEPLRKSNWHDAAHGADLIVLTTDELAPGLDRLVAAREAEGLRVAVVPVADIYDEFGYGQASPDSIHRFLTHVYHQWSPPAPRYLLLVGDATIDYRGYLTSRPENPTEPPRNIIPSYLVPVNFSGETVSDTRLVDVDGDFKPEMAVGRWPVDDVRTVERLVERTLAYEAAEAPEQSIFAFDASSGEFSALTERLLAQSEFPTDRVEQLDGAEVDRLVTAWNAGAWLVTYTGHGSLSLWGKDGMFSSGAVDQLHAAQSAIVLQLTCLTGLFAHPETSSLSEALLVHDTGPVLQIAATSLTLSTHQEPFAAAFLRAIRDEQVGRIGDALLFAKDTLDVDNPGVREVNDTFGLIGDPSARIVRP